MGEKDETPVPAVLAPRTFTKQDLESYATLFNFAQALAKESCLPKGLTAGSAWVAMSAALDLGLSPTVGLGQVTVINGRPRVSVELGLALVRRSGLLAAEPVVEYFGQDADPKTTADSEVGCRVTIQRKGAPPVSLAFTIKDARRAGLWGKEGPWSAHPKRMLRARPLGFLLHDVFGDVLSGVGLVDEAGGSLEPEDTEPPHAPAEGTDPLLLAPPAKPETPDTNVPQDRAATPSTAQEPAGAATAEPEAQAPVEAVVVPPAGQAQSGAPAVKRGPTPEEWTREAEAASAKRAAERAEIEARTKGPSPFPPPAPPTERAVGEPEPCAHGYALERARARPGTTVICSCGFETTYREEPPAPEPPALVLTPEKAEPAVPKGEKAVAVAETAGNLSDADKVKLALQRAKERVAAKQAAASK